ncbi:MAG: glycosyltransferase family 4 protein [Nitrospirae bacterium]|nr:glycosyltransferase family 4 protein [Nitrospirota bacterium]
MHILFLSDNFPPEVNAPASRTFEHCREWVKEGHQVTVMTCAPNFPRGEVYEGYRNKLWQTEKMEGIRVIRVWTYITANQGFFRRTIDYLSYMVSAILASPFVKDVDLVIGTSPQFFTACGAWAVSRLKRKPFVFELRDIWPESVKTSGVIGDSGFYHLAKKIELFLYRRADKIIAVTESFKEYLGQQGIDVNKIETVTNGVDLSRFKPAEKDRALAKQLDLSGKFVAGYIGTLGLAHALETLLEAANQMKKAPGGDQFRFIFLGDGAKKGALKEKAKALRLDNVLFIDSVPKSEVIRYWSLLDASIIHLKKTELFKGVIPSKLFESMGMGIPILHGVEGESLRIVEKEGAGLSFEPENSKELIEKLLLLQQNKSLYNQLKQNAIQSAPKYDRTALAHKMLTILLKQFEPDK